MEYKYLPPEWSDWDDFEMFNDVNRIAKKCYEGYEERGEDFCEYRQKFFNTAFQAMKELEEEGLFGTKTNERFLILCVSDSDNEIMDISAKELNTEKTYKEFVSIF